MGRNNSDNWEEGIEVNDYLKPEKVKSFDNKIIKQISCGKYHTIVLTNDGLLYGWGEE